MYNINIGPLVLLKSSTLACIHGVITFSIRILDAQLFPFTKIKIISSERKQNIVGLTPISEHVVPVCCCSVGFCMEHALTKEHLNSTSLNEYAGLKYISSSNIEHLIF